jgi:hypothetical protein
MATASNDCPEPRPTPERVAVETPAGNIRSGEVVDVFMTAEANDIERWFVVDIDGHRLRTRASEARAPTIE